MLDRAGFSPGEIDGRDGPNVRRAAAAYQQAADLPVTGRIDTASWTRLWHATGQEPPLVSYTARPEDVDGPFTPHIPADLIEQARLKALGYRNALEALGEKFHASPALLQRLNPGARFSQPGEKLLVPNVSLQAPEPKDDRQTPRPPVGTSGVAEDMIIYVTKATSALTVENRDGAVLFHAPVTSGSEHDPLPLGTWKVTGVHQMPVFNYNPDLFWDADPAQARARIAPGPNNPVGTVWIDLSKEHYGIHGTPEPSRVGHTQSHGCVRLTNWDAQRVAQQWARPGTTVIFR